MSPNLTIKVLKQQSPKKRYFPQESHAGRTKERQLQEAHGFHRETLRGPNNSQDEVEAHPDNDGSVGVGGIIS